MMQGICYFSRITRSCAECKSFRTAGMVLRTAGTVIAASVFWTH
jgi:hypothetical protein